MDDRCRRGRFRGHGEEGVYLVLYALLAVALFTMAAIVLDMTSLREDKRAAGLAADLAATAGAAHLDPAVPTTVRDACLHAWGYFRANADDEDAGTVTNPDCDLFATSVCSAGAPRTVTGYAGPYVVEVTNPVPDTSPLMRAEAGPGDTPQPVTAFDGGECERLGVRIVRTRALAFAGVVGFGSGRVDVHAVARPTSPTTFAPSLIVTDPTACTTLLSGSGGVLNVAGVPGRPGIAYVASDGSGCSTDHVISVPNGTIAALPSATAAGVIHSAAIVGLNPLTAYDPADTSANRLSPTPSSPPPTSVAATAFVTERFNCTAPTCPANSNPIADLRNALSGVAPAPPTPTGYITYSTANFVPTAPGDICNLGSADPAPVFLATDNVFVDCPSFSVANNVTFPANVVFRGGVTVRDGGCLAVRDTTCSPVSVSVGDGVVYLRGGDLIKEGGARLVLTGTFVHLTGSSATTTGRLDAPPESGGARQLTWTSPLGGDFENLLLWAESAGAMQLGGHSTFEAEGLVFAPNTTRFELRALSSGTSAAMQLVAGRVELTDNKTFTIAPVAGRVIEVSRRDVRLIR